jgi:hypothetical protein
VKIRVFLDTNFFMMPYKNRIDVFSEIERLMSSDYEYELATLESVKKELMSLKEKSRGEDKVAAGVGLGLLESKSVKIVGDANTRWADEELLKIAGENRAATVICTNDKRLRKTLMERGIPVISMRSKRYLDYA